MSNDTITVFWVTGCREFLPDLIKDFNNKTSKLKIKNIVYQWDNSLQSKNIKKRLLKLKYIEKVITLDKPSCLFNIRNLCLDRVKSKLCLILEDDVRVKRNLKKNWLFNFVKVMERESLDGINLWNSGAGDNYLPTLGSIYRVKSFKNLLPLPHYPKNFKSITESMRNGHIEARKIIQSAKLKIKNFPVLETTCSFPSKNFCHLVTLGAISNEQANRLVKNNYTISRQFKKKWFDHQYYDYVDGRSSKEVIWTLHHNKDNLLIFRNINLRYKIKLIILIKYIKIFLRIFKQFIYSAKNKKQI